MQEGVRSRTLCGRLRCVMEDSEHLQAADLELTSARVKVSLAPPESARKRLAVRQGAECLLISALCSRAGVSLAASGSGSNVRRAPRGCQLSQSSAV